ncbi:MAG: DNA polymerase III subunit delta' [Pseudonocardiales bacterium]|nr:MAG: DNA polymerase III subunit delta' [Pseudonocardiales bacterium]
MSVWDEVVGQPEAVRTLAEAAAAAAGIVAGQAGAGGAMTHAWLFTGPAGSGRSVAARAFAAALQCPDQGCGACPQCHQVLTGTHADVRRVVPEGLSIPVAQMRALVLRAAQSPMGGRWQVILVEDADRLTEAASNALLKAVEEPPARSIYLLCAPSTHPDDVSVTIRSRCRLVSLRTPGAADIAAVLIHRDGIDAAMAQWAARAAQGHIGRARRLARDEQARARRQTVLALPRSLTGLGACFDAAEELIAAVEEEAAALTKPLDATETDALKQALGAGGTGKGAAAATRGTAGQLKELDRVQRSRRTRAQRDALDRALVDLAAFYRDVLAVRLGARVPAVHADIPDVISRAALAWPPESVLRRLEAVLGCREAVELNVKPKIAVEAMAIALRAG